MKAILLAGGKGTRLRPLTLHTPKPIVPIFNRPFLHYQIDLLKQVPGLNEVILSLNYQPRRIEDVFGDGRGVGLPIRYLVEPQPLGTGGAIKFAEPHLDGPVIVFNGDVLTEIDLNAVLALHRSRKAKATIVLTPVENPTAYGLVETAPDGAVQRFLEKPKPDEITTNNINAGIYVLEPDTFDRIPKDTPYSIERSYFPSLVERGEAFVAYVYKGYWIDIGTPEKYTQVHRDIMSGAFSAAPFAGAKDAVIAEGAKIEEGAVVAGAVLHRRRHGGAPRRPRRAVFRHRQGVPHRGVGGGARLDRVVGQLDRPRGRHRPGHRRPQRPRRPQRHRQPGADPRRQVRAHRLHPGLSPLTRSRRARPFPITTCLKSSPASSRRTTSAASIPARSTRWSRTRSAAPTSPT